MNPLASIPDNELTHAYWKRVKDQARYEREWAIIDNQRLPALAEITGWFTGESHASAERKARISPEYQQFLAKSGKIKEEITLARGRVKALDLEIRLRLNKSYSDRTEYKGGRLQT